MAPLKFVDSHNMVAFLTKSAESEGFEQIVDFLKANPIKYALTVNPTIYISCIEQFWATAKVKTVNEEVQLQDLVDRKKVIITEAMAGSDDENPPPPPPPQTPTQQAPHTVLTIKLPILKKGECDIWAMKMEHYLSHTDYPIWEVIQKGNGPVSVSTDTNGVIKVLPPKTAEEILARERERKARTTLLMALPEDHLAKFHKMTDAKDMWDAIKSRFGGNDESKKMQKYILKQQFEGFFVSNSEGLHKGYDRFQSLLSQLEIHGAGVSTEDANQKFLRSLPSSWSQVSLVMRTKPGVDSLSFDDLYNNLRVFESDVKGSTRSSSSAQNVAFVSSESTSSTNDVSTAYGVSTSSGYNSQRENSSSYTDELMYSFFANQSSGPHLDHEDLEQLDEFDLEEMDLKWQVAMISIRLKKFYKKTGRKLHFDAKEPVRFNKTKVECYNCHKKGNFARECRSKGNTGCVDWTNHAEDEQENFALMAYSNSGSDTEMSKRDESGLGYEDQVHDGVLSYENEVFQSVFDSRSSDVEDSHVHDRFANVEGMHAVPPPMTGNYMPSGPDRETDDSIFTYGPKQSKTSESDTQTSNYNSYESNSSAETLEYVPEPVVVEPKVVSEPKVWSDDPIIEEYESDTVLTRTGRIPVNTARQNLSSQAATTNTTRKVNIARPIVNEIRPRNNFYKSHSPIRRPFNRTTTPKANFLNQKVNTAEVKAVSAIGGKRETAVKPSADPLGRPKPKMAWVPKEIIFLLMYRISTKRFKGTKGISIVDVQDTGLETKYLVKYQDYNRWPVVLECSKGYINGKRCDNGTELKNKDIIEFCGSKGIKREYSNAKTPQQNEVAERKNMTLIEAARTMLADSFLPNTFWAEAVSTACYVLNRPVRSENQANKTAGPEEANLSAGTQDNIDAGNSEIEAESAQDYFVLPIWSSYTSLVKSSEAKNKGENSTKNIDLKTNEKPVDQEDQVFLDEIERLKRQEKETNDAAKALRKE
ncbi:ribonuclease H-like domain-containing protein, partial [Tanacetum coccineum]